MGGDRRGKEEKLEKKVIDDNPQNEVTQKFENKKVVEAIRGVDDDSFVSRIDQLKDNIAAKDEQTHASEVEVVALKTEKDNLNSKAEKHG